MAKFIIRGQSYEIDPEKIRQTMKGHQPERITKYFVEFNNQRYPIKQVIATVCGIPPISFTSRLEGLGGLKVSADEIEQLVHDFRPETMDEWSQRLFEHPETALMAGRYISPTVYNP